MAQERTEAKEMSEDLKKRISTFTYDNREMLVIVADPDSDVVVVGYKDQLEAHRLTLKKDGSRANIVKDMLSYKGEKDDLRGKDSISSFLLLLDGSIIDLAKRLKGKGNKE